MLGVTRLVWPESSEIDKTRLYIIRGRVTEIGYTTRCIL